MKIHDSALVAKFTEKHVTRNERRRVVGGQKAHRIACRAFNRALRRAGRVEVVTTLAE